MDVSWLDPAAPDERLLAGLAAVAEAAREADTPTRRPLHLAHHREFVRHGWEGDPPLAGVALDGPRVVAWFRLSLPTRDNLHLAAGDIVVDPLLRRRGLGRELLGVLIDKAKEHDRRLMILNPFNDSPGGAFAVANGFEAAYWETQRVQRVLELDADRLAALRREAARTAADYELTAYVGALPDDLVEEVGELTNTLNDAPLDALDVEDEVFDADRIRVFERIQVVNDRRLHRVIARHRGTGEAAGLSAVAVEGGQPWTATQYDTLVARPHRGHRLGLLLKLEMLRHLAAAEPQLRTIHTWNADSNAHMIRVNEQLGYEVVTGATEWTRSL
jgi:GNAT superfamily N-acetyltransferase